MLSVRNSVSRISLSFSFSPPHSFMHAHTDNGLISAPYEVYVGFYNGRLDNTSCVDIPIDDDDVVENDDYYTIHLSSDNQFVAVGNPATAVVQVEDDDCKSIASQ